MNSRYLPDAPIDSPDPPDINLYGLGMVYYMAYSTSLLMMVTSAPYLSKTFTTSVWAWDAAPISGVQPFYIYTYSKVELLLTAETYPPNHTLSYVHVLKYTD